MGDVSISLTSVIGAEVFGGPSGTLGTPATGLNFEGRFFGRRLTYIPVPRDQWSNPDYQHPTYFVPSLNVSIGYRLRAPYLNFMDHADNPLPNIQHGVNAGAGVTIGRCTVLNNTQPYTPENLSHRIRPEFRNYCSWFMTFRASATIYLQPIFANVGIDYQNLYALGRPSSDGNFTIGYQLSIGTSFNEGGSGFYASLGLLFGRAF